MRPIICFQGISLHNLSAFNYWRYNGVVFKKWSISSKILLLCQGKIAEWSWKSSRNLGLATRIFSTLTVWTFSPSRDSLNNLCRGTVIFLISNTVKILDLSKKSEGMPYIARQCIFVRQLYFSSCHEIFCYL